MRVIANNKTVKMKAYNIVASTLTLVNYLSLFYVFFLGQEIKFVEIPS